MLRVSMLTDEGEVDLGELILEADFTASIPQTATIKDLVIYDPDSDIHCLANVILDRYVVTEGEVLKVHIHIRGMVEGIFIKK